MKIGRKILAVLLALSMLFAMLISGVVTVSAAPVVDFSSIGSIFDWRAPLHPAQMGYGQAYGFPRSASDAQEGDGSGGSIIPAGSYVLQDGVLYKQTGNGSFADLGPGAVPNWYYGWSPRVQFPDDPGYGVLAKGGLIGSYEKVGELNVSRWTQGTAVAAGAYVYFNNVLFRCTTANSAAALNYNPITYASAYIEICDFNSGYEDVDISGLADPDTGIDFSSISSIFDWRAPLHPAQLGYGQTYGFPRSSADPQEGDGAGGSVIQSGSYVLQDGILYRQTGNGSFADLGPGAVPNWYYGWCPKSQFPSDPDYGVLAKGGLIGSYEKVGALSVSRWTQGTAVAAGAYVFFNEKLFRCKTANSASALNFNPITYASAYTEICGFNSGYALVDIDGLVAPDSDPGTGIDFSIISNIFDWRAPLHPAQLEYGQTYGFPRSSADPQEGDGAGGSIIPSGTYVLQNGMLYKQTGNGSFADVGPGAVPNWNYGWSPKVQFDDDPDYGVLAKGGLIGSYEKIGELDVSRWTQGTAVAVGDYVYFNEKLFECTLANSAAALNYNPITYASAYTELCNFNSGYGLVDIDGLVEPGTEPDPEPDPAYASKRVVGYLPWWRIPESDQLDYSKLDYVNIAFLRYTNDGWDFGSDGGFSDAAIQNIVDKAHAAGAKVFISVGGGNGGFIQDSLPFYYENSREYLANCIFEVIDKFGFDGVDMDAETDDVKFWIGYSDFVYLMRIGLDARNLEMSMAVHPWFTDLIEDDSIYEKYDFLNVMSYDCQYDRDGNYTGIGETDQAPMWHTYQLMDYYTSKGVPAENLNVGMPFYYYRASYGWDGAVSWVWQSGLPASSPLANEISIDTKPGESKADAWWRVNQQKAYLGSTEYGGAFIWEIGQDDFGNASNNMLKMVYNTIKNPEAANVPPIEEADKLYYARGVATGTDLPLTPVNRSSVQPDFPALSDGVRLLLGDYWWLGAGIGNQKTITIPTGAEVVWSVREIINSDPAKSSIISVDAGVITALAEGCAVVDVKVNGVRVASINVQVLGAEPLTFTDSGQYDIPASSVGTAITDINVSGGVSGGTGPYTFSAAGLPSGLSIDSATGVISGTPDVAGPAGTATITVTDSASATQSITINFGIIYPAGVKSVTVGAQVGALTEGIVGTVTFSVNTTNIADGTYPATLANAPAGVSVQGGTVTIVGGIGTLTLAGDTSTLPGTVSNVTLTIDDTRSAAFSVTISADPNKPPHTGVNDGMALWFLLGGAALAVVVGTAIIGKKRKYRIVSK